jgi:osmotically-inducible protein OsmY
MLFALAAAAGAALAFFLDPTSGRRRRATVAQRVPGFFRHRGRQAGRLSRTVSAEAYGLKQKATHLREQPKGDLDDVTIAHKVETELFRPAGVPKGQINVNVQEGVVQLRGEVPNPDLIDDLVRKARSIQGVREVENLLHLPGTPAPTHR